MVTQHGIDQIFAFACIYLLTSLNAKIRFYGFVIGSLGFIPGSYLLIATELWWLLAATQERRARRTSVFTFKKGPARGHKKYRKPEKLIIKKLKKKENIRLKIHYCTLCVSKKRKSLKEHLKH